MENENSKKLMEKEEEIFSLKDYIKVLQNTIIKLEDRFTENKKNLIELINNDILKNLESSFKNQKSVVIDKNSKVSKKSHKNVSGAKVNILEEIMDTKSLVTNRNILDSQRKLDFNKLTPYYNNSFVEASVKNASVIFMEEIKKLNSKYNNVMCSLENLNLESPMILKKETENKALNSVNNDQFRDFFKTLANRVRDKYEDNLSSKVFESE